MNLVKLSILILVIDGIYLSLIKNKFQKMILKIQNKTFKMNYFYAALSYFFIVFGFKRFVIDKKLSLTDSFYLGCTIYGIYEATNAATIENWDKSLIIIDTIWGGVLFYIITYLYRKLNIF